MEPSIRPADGYVINASIGYLFLKSVELERNGRPNGMASALRSRFFPNLAITIPCKPWSGLLFLSSSLIHHELTTSRL